MKEVGGGEIGGHKGNEKKGRERILKSRGERWGGGMGER